MTVWTRRSRFKRETDAPFVWHRARKRRGLRLPALLVLGATSVGLGYYVSRVATVLESQRPGMQAESAIGGASEPSPAAEPRPDGSQDPAASKNKRADSPAAPDASAAPPVVLLDSKAPSREPPQRSAGPSAKDDRTQNVAEPAADGPGRDAKRLPSRDRQPSRRVNEGEVAPSDSKPAEPLGEARRRSVEKWGPAPSYRSWAEPGGGRVD